MMMLSSLLMQIKMKGALVFPPVALSSAQAVSIMLVKANHPRVPRGYLMFLEQSDGLQYDGLEFFSCAAHDRAGTVFEQPTLEAYQTKYADNPFFAHRLVLGRTMESLVCYHAQNKYYELIHRDGLQVILKFPRFMDVFYYLIKE